MQLTNDGAAHVVKDLIALRSHPHLIKHIDNFANHIAHHFWYKLDRAFLTRLSTDARTTLFLRHVRQ